METCSICFDDIKNNHIKKKLSCNHTLHFCCFKKNVFFHGNFFIACPLCRRINTNTEIPTNDNKKNILLLSHSGVTKLRCNHIKKNGTICKLKSHIMNYGCCHIHNKSILPKEKYKIFSIYLYHILTTNYKWISMLYLIDFGKKIIINLIDKDDGIEKVLHYLYRYLHLGNHLNDKFFMNQIYKFYNIEEPPAKWMKYCVDKKTII
jgi:hypothetical protein